MENKDRKVERREANRESVREKHQQLDALNGNRAILIELLILELAHNTQRLILPHLFIGHVTDSLAFLAVRYFQEI